MTSSFGASWFEVMFRYECQQGGGFDKDLDEKMTASYARVLQKMEQEAKSRADTVTSITPITPPPPPPQEPPYGGPPVSRTQEPTAVEATPFK